MKESRIDQLEVPTLAPGESWSDLADESFDVELAGTRGYGYEKIDQLAIEHLMGVK